MKFCSLHSHTTYSSLDGFGTVAEHVRRAADVGMPALGLTEHGNVSSHVPLEKACDQVGVRPLYGCELYTAGPKQQKKYHLTVLAKTEEGYRNLLEIVSASWRDGFYYQPTVDWQTLCAHNKGLWVFSGCQGSMAFCSAVGGKGIPEGDASYEKFLGVANSFHAVFGSRYLLEVQAHPTLEKTALFNPMAERASNELGIPLVATLDTHYPNTGDNEIQAVLHYIRNGQKDATLEDAKAAWGYTEDLSIPSSDHAVETRLVATGLSMNAAGCALRATGGIVGSTENFRLPRSTQVSFGVDLPSKALWDACIDGVSRRRLKRNVVLPRLTMEYETIISKGFEDYFLIVADLVRWAKEQGIAVGPGRGSAAASFVCYVLGITEVNPLDYPAMVFDRFIDADRDDLPDIDIDFDSHRRREVRDYMASRYGEDRVSNVGTFNLYRGRNSVDDIARVHKIPRSVAEAFKSLLVEGGHEDYESISATIARNPVASDIVARYPELQEAARLEGNVRSMGVHAAGVVVSSVPITDICAVYSREVAGQLTDVISLDKKSSERQGLLKIDLLGLNTMSVIARAVEEIQVSEPDFTLEELYNVELDDPRVMDMFREDDLTGIFQFEGCTTRRICAEVQPETILDLAAINALSRPGAYLGVPAYVAAKSGLIIVDPILLEYDAITADTYGQIIFQEQILRICREVGEMSVSDSNKVRRAFSRKYGADELEKFFLAFQTGVAKKYGSDAGARKIWDKILAAGDYAFNIPHSVSYSILAYYTAWLKWYWPVEFHFALLVEKPDKTKEYLASAISRGIEVYTPEFGAKATWEIRTLDSLVAGWGQVPGIGEKMAQKIVDADPRSWTEFLLIPGIGEKTVEKIRTFAEAEDSFGVALSLTNERNRVKV